ncbi:MAG: oxygen-independent coproporphyrinogen III oxidase [Alphaproteobacteria bacterium]|nr:oxygen-independent coproporphyrinogen III oxidase [Alphaproteobacteria bacterium]
MNPELALKYATPVPRYTSYPTAPHFSTDIDHRTYRRWLSELNDEPLSLYVHIPFCDTLCWYCGCATKATRRYDPVANYMDALLGEVAEVADSVGKKRRVSHVHWGGGSPNILEPADILRLAHRLQDAFDWAVDAEFAVEIDPRRLDDARVAAFAEAGVTRVSLGVQDFAKDVQEAINRLQSFEQTRDALTRFRSAGVGSVNIDLVYGLPHQTRDSVANTIDQVLELAPDRIALFGYAHLPQRITHQRLIDTATLPGAIERFAQSNRVANHILDAGYVRVGLDHFAKPGDALAKRAVKRNFQGYTSDDADILIGFGASAIGHLPQGYVQNTVPTAEYIRNVRSDRGLAVVRGFALSEEDRARSFVINGLMCDLVFSLRAVRAQYGGALAEQLEEEAEMVIDADVDGLVERTPDGFRITEKGRPFVRSICACFDAYLERSTAAGKSPRYSVGV